MAASSPGSKVNVPFWIWIGLLLGASILFAVIAPPIIRAIVEHRVDAAALTDFRRRVAAFPSANSDFDLLAAEERERLIRVRHRKSGRIFRLSPLSLDKENRIQYPFLAVRQSPIPSWLTYPKSRVDGPLRASSLSSQAILSHYRRLLEANAFQVPASYDGEGIFACNFDSVECAVVLIHKSQETETAFSVQFRTAEDFDPTPP